MDKTLAYQNWLETCIEPEIRPLVKHLRDRGINTTCSCGHEMWIEGDVLDIEHEEWVITTSLLELGYNDFDITYTRSIGQGKNYFRFYIKIN